MISTEQVQDLKNKLVIYKFPILLCFVGIILILGGLFASDLFPKKKITYTSQLPIKSVVANTQLASENQSRIKIDVSGAVNSPGVYSLKSSDRVEDAIKAAGGLSPSVNKLYISKYINLSQKLSDGIKIYVPFDGEDSISIPNDIEGNSKVSVNQSSADSLESLPGVGTVTATKIIKARPYSNLEELVSKKVISLTLFNKIKDLIDL